MMNLLVTNPLQYQASTSVAIAELLSTPNVVGVFS